MNKPFLVLNAGSSSIKLTLFAPDLRQMLTGMADAIRGNAALRIGAITSRPPHAQPSSRLGRDL